MPDDSIAHGPGHEGGYVAHQFETAEQQQDAASLGMWAFLVTEVLFFGGLFGAYAVYGWSYPEAFAEASNHLNFRIGWANTYVLISSSMTMALAVHAAQSGRRGRTVAFLLVTIALGLAFLVVKVFEYRDKFEHHLFPGPDFRWEGANAGGAEIFYSLYFALTGMHAVHMVIGIGVLGTIAFLAYRGRFSAEYNTPVEIAGLYWHFVDVVWIYLFPLLYLLGRA